MKHLEIHLTRNDKALFKEVREHTIKQKNIPFLWTESTSGRALWLMPVVSTLGGRSGWIIWGEEFETSLANMMKPHLYQNYNRQAWWQALVIPSTWEAEAGELLEPGRQRLK